MQGGYNLSVMIESLDDNELAPAVSEYKFVIIINELLPADEHESTPSAIQETEDSYIFIEGIDRFGVLSILFL